MAKISPELCEVLGPMKKHTHVMLLVNASFHSDKKTVCQFSPTAVGYEIIMVE